MAKISKQIQMKIQLINQFTTRFYFVFVSLATL